MSTMLTINNPTIEVPLGQLLLNAQQWTFQGILHLMAERGHTAFTVAHLMFLANLDCGTTHASLVAKRMGVSRQAVYRTTKELQALDVLTLENDLQKRNQKIIRMTPHGTKVVLDARDCLNTVEVTLKGRLGVRDFERLSNILRLDWGPILGES
ncbi:MAG: hypothetical protein PHH36_09090 [Sideroxydans sp.]|nr:hypothetical protein [Sideroxydans sp.]